MIGWKLLELHRRGEAEEVTVCFLCLARKLGTNISEFFAAEGEEWSGLIYSERGREGEGERGRGREEEREREGEIV